MPYVICAFTFGVLVKIILLSLFSTVVLLYHIFLCRHLWTMPSTKSLSDKTEQDKEIGVENEKALL